MASYLIGEDKLAVHDKTLVASTVDTVTFFDAPREVEILSDGAAKIYVTTNGVTPTVGGDVTRILPASPCARTIRMESGKAVKLISVGTPTYSVTRV